MPKSRKSPLPHSSSSVKNILTHFKNNLPPKYKSKNLSKLTKEELKKIVRALLLVYHPNKCQRNSPRTRQYCHNASVLIRNLPNKQFRPKTASAASASASTPRRQTAKSGKPCENACKRTNSILFGHNFAPIWQRPQRRRNRRDCGC